MEYFAGLDISMEETRSALSTAREWWITRRR